ncbi:Protein SAWADEE HOMEODOMAIN 2 [Hirschfeldia incana]|nr:Protein SAWADEE HOMEODOMAIN 2 [Hirschfeldia incana]
MGRPPSNGSPAFRFNLAEVTEMEAILLQHNTAMPGRHTLEALADKFSNTVERKGKTVVQFKQIWNWFQNKRYALRARGNKAPGKLNVSSMPRPLDPTNPMRNVLPPSAGPKPTHMTGHVMTPSPSVPGVMRSGSDNSYLEFEAKSARDGAWYDVQAFLAHRNLEIGDPEVQVRFAGFEVEEDEWINVKRHVRQRSLPCEASECVAVLAGDLVLCFQEGKDQALYFDAVVLDAQRRRHDVRGCRCRFLVRYSHDQSEQEIVPLRKICRRPETDYRLQQLHSAANDFANSNQLQKPAPEAAAKAPLPQSTASVSTVPTDVKDPSLSASATSAQPSSNAATVPAGSA